MEEKAFSRRAFISGLAVSGIAGWLCDSDSLAARLARGTVLDSEREMVRIAPADLSDWSDRTLDLCWIGHATVLINFFGVRILTDPALFPRIGAQTGFGTFGRKRIVGPALNPENLPRIDLVLLSHAHMDHLDLPSLAVMPRHARVVTASKTADLLADFRFASVQELKWGERARVQTVSGDMELEALEVKHWGARWRSDSWRGYNGYLLRRGDKSILFGGDTAETDSFSRLKCRERRPVAAIMPIGCYGGSTMHCTPEQAVRMADDAGAEMILPIHHGTFPLGREPLREPLERLEAAIPASRIALSAPGESWRCPV